MVSTRGCSSNGRALALHERGFVELDFGLPRSYQEVDMHICLDQDINKGIAVITSGLRFHISKASWFFYLSFRRCFCRSDEEKGTISVTFVSKDGEEIPIQVPIGMSMLEAAHENVIELEGACEGSLAFSTCHVRVMDMEYYNKLEDPVDEENDMLDLAFGLTETSRLGCQIVASPELDGICLAIPAASRNFAVDGYVPKPH
ncbi:adrenodoxin-like protein 1, mitochondrial [Gossypium arboreum]|uniref:adrenodoxin-like protein 1, mitochondrial n=1 Tax=Gossypium arboreum TaxID=29729 RepID=UPI0022F1C9FE|nr:adrenodoxin-like protein 1, mitochondrial [Gossypium arboreum]